MKEPSGLFKPKYNPTALLLELLAGSGFGAVVGVRHALEPDHFAAVATLIGGEPKSSRAALLGVYWGVGHTVTIVAVGAALLVLQAEIPARASSIIDLIVSAMLVCLGVRAVLQAARTSEADRNGSILFEHAAVGEHVHTGHRSFTRPLLVGAIHGLAGSGALTALVLATLPSTSSQLAYVALFGLGSTLSMAAMSGLFGWPLAQLGPHHGVARCIIFVVGFGSAALGIAWGSATLDLF